MRLTVTLSDAVAEQVRDLATRTGQSVSAVVAEALERHVTEARRRHAFEVIDTHIGAGHARPDAGDELGAMRDASDRDDRALGSA